MNDYEPPMKRRLVKHKITPPDRFDLCNLSASLWFELILKRLFLVALIQMKRTCKTFATLKALKYLIKDKEYSCFGDIRQKYWNNVTGYEATNRIVFADNPGRFILYILTPHDKKQGVFSSKQLLLQELDREHLFDYNITEIDYHTEDVVITAYYTKDRRNTYFVIKGVNDYLKNVLKK